MVVPERQMYIENSRYMAYKHFEKNQMLVCYVREKRPSQRWNVQPEQAKAIRSCLNLVGDKVSPMPALCLINDSLPAELQFSLSGGRHRHESIDTPSKPCLPILEVYTLRVERLKDVTISLC